MQHATRARLREIRARSGAAAAVAPERTRGSFGWQAGARYSVVVCGGARRPLRRARAHVRAEARFRCDEVRCGEWEWRRGRRRREVSCEHAGLRAGRQ